MASKATSHTNNVADEAEILKAQTEIINHCYAFADSLAIRSAVELRIPDIIHSHGHPMTITEIASKLNSTSPNIPSLDRIMRALTRKNIFTLDYNQQNEPLYGLTSISKWLRLDSNLSFAPMFLALSHRTTVAPWHEISRSLTEGGVPFVMAHGETMWEKSSKEPEFNEMFNSGMAFDTKMTMNAVLEGYKDGFSKIEGTLVDVGGGMGKAVTAIVKAHPHIKGINFDLPHVVATAPPAPGVTHVGGDMFVDIPKADAVFMKSILHDWGDDDCIKILKNIRKSISEKGKLLIGDIVLESDANKLLEDAKRTVDLLMMTLCCDGKERTENEFKKIIFEAGFTRYNIIKIDAIVSIIEAFP
ncbi:hypothetical protein RND81_11G100000 [Saponaria officinalis]|uniref:Uncharacterized protein n=1 Tax=Saponaria officinalis TaxID=3572 RepID=A0AAW1HK60_SAPOF